MAKLMTLERHIAEQERQHPEASGDFSGLLSDIALAAKIISREVNKAGIANILGKTDSTNVHGEVVKKLDVFANQVMINAMDHGGHLCIMASEENEVPIEIPSQYPLGKYVMVFDPLDGSSNIDANVSIGTIFSLFRRKSQSGPGTIKDCLQPGVNQEAAGYVLYGSSTMFVYTTGDGVHGFTFDPSLGEFLLSDENIRIPKQGKIYSVNEGNYGQWTRGTQQYIDFLKSHSPESGTPYSLRYIGSLVADFHRNLMYGGIFLYPGDKKNPSGKLRLTYEANPMALIVEQAGGAASTGTQRIMELEPESLHQRTPLIIGSRLDVEMAEHFLKQKQEA